MQMRVFLIIKLCSLSISQIPKNAKLVIQEMGMSFPNEIKYLSNLTKPDISIITNIGGSHLETLTTYLK